MRLLYYLLERFWIKHKIKLVGTRVSIASINFDSYINETESSTIRWLHHTVELYISSMSHLQE